MISIIDSVCDRQSEQYLDENSKQYARRLWNFLGIVDGSPHLRIGSKGVKLNPIRLPIIIGDKQA